MADQAVVSATGFRSLATPRRAANSKSTSGGEVVDAFLAPDSRNSSYPASVIKPKTRKQQSSQSSKNVKQWLGNGGKAINRAFDRINLGVVASHVSYLKRKTTELRKWYLKVLVGPSELGDGVVCMEPYFSIPVVVPTNG